MNKTKPSSITFFVLFFSLLSGFSIAAQTNSSLEWEYMDSLFKKRDYAQIIAIADLVLTEEEQNIVSTKALVWKGRSLFRTGKYEKCVAILDTAIQQLGTPVDSIPLAYQAYAYNDRGNALILLSERDKALESFEKALEIRLQILGDSHTLVAGTYINMSNIYDSRGDYDQALEYVNRAREIRTQLFGKLAAPLNNIYYKIGQIYLHQGYYREAITYLDTTRQIREAAYGYYHPQVAAVLSLQGGTYIRLGDLKRALNHHLQSLAVCQKTLGDEHNFTAGSYGNIGQVYLEMNEPDSAYQYFIKSIAIKDAIFSNKTEEHAISYNNLGIVETRRKNYDAARGWLEKARAIHENDPDGETFLLVDNYLNLAQLFREQQDFEKAISHYQKALKIAQEFWGEYHPNIANCYNGMSAVAMAQGDFGKAIQLNQEAEIALFPEGVEQNNFDAALSLAFLFEVYLQRVEVYQTAYQVTQENDYATKALNTIALVDRLIQFQRTGYKDAGSQNLVSKNAKVLYEKGLQLCMNTLSDHNLKEHHNLAFDFIEKSKSQQLLNSLRTTSRQLSFVGVPADLIYQKDKYRDDLNHLETKILNSENDSLKQILSGQLFTAKEKYYELLEDLEQNYPNYYNLKYRSATSDLATLQKALTKNSASISYFVGDSTLYSMAVTTATVELFQQALPNDFRTRIVALLQALRSPASSIVELKEQIVFIDQLLFSQVIGSLPPSITQLIIIPDDILAYIPFEILQANTDNFMNTYQISYANSATLLQQQNATSTQRARNIFGGFAPDYQQFQLDPEESITSQDLAILVRSGDYQLPGAQSEVEQITALLEGTAFINTQATEAIFKQRAMDFNILHLSMHSLFNDQQPLFSKLLFTPTIDSTEDGFLYAAELYNMQLNADLAVLSACNTGVGKLEKGEGLMNLSRAFTYAGVPATIMSLWQVPDQATAEIMVAFYEHLKSGMTKDAALRQAKIDYLDNTLEPDQRHPYYWAGFIAEGNMKAVNLKQSTWWKWWLIGGAFLLGIGLFMRTRFKRIPATS